MSFFKKNPHLDHIMNQMQSQLDEQAFSAPIQYAVAERDMVSNFFKANTNSMPLVEAMSSFYAGHPLACGYPNIAIMKHKHKINAKKYGRI